MDSAFGATYFYLNGNQLTSIVQTVNFVGICSDVNWKSSCFIGRSLDMVKVQCHSDQWKKKKMFGISSYQLKPLDRIPNSNTLNSDFPIGFAKSPVFAGATYDTRRRTNGFYANKVLSSRSTSSVLHSNANAYTVCDMRAVYAEYREMEETASKTENEMTHLNEYLNLLFYFLFFFEFTFFEWCESTARRLCANVVIK